MRRLALNVATALSLVAAITVVAVWHRSATHQDHVMAYTAGGRCAAVNGGPDGLTVAWAPAMACAPDLADGSDVPGFTVLRHRSPTVVRVDEPLARQTDDEVALAFYPVFFTGLPFELWNPPSVRHDGFGYAVDRWKDPLFPVLRSAVDPSAPGPPRSWTVRRAAVPFWFPLALAALLPLARLARRFARRRPPGCCRRCGYDLRATPGRCPECGAVAG